MHPSPRTQLRHTGPRRARALLALAAIVAGAWASAGPARAAEPGVTPDLTWGISSVQQDAQAAALKRAGVRWVRLNVEWNTTEPSPGAYNAWSLANYDHAIRVARANGMKVLMLVSRSPSWASGSGDREAPPQDPATYARFVHFLAARWAGKVSAWEIWNEENTTRFWPGTGPSPSAYAALLRAAFAAVKSADPAALVVFGGTTPNDVAFIKAAYSAGAGGAFDVMAVHPYTCDAPEQTGKGGVPRPGDFTGYRLVRSLMLANGDDKPIWLTEFGWSTTTAPCGVTQQAQADYLGRAYRLIDADPYVGVALWYGWRNAYWAHDADTLESQYGLLRVDGTQKPAYLAFERYAASRPAPASTAPGAGTPGAATPGALTPGTSGAGPHAPGTQAPGAGAADAPPTVALRSPRNGVRFDRSLRLAATARDDRGIAKVSFLVDGSVVATDRTIPFAKRWRVPRRVAAGAHTVTAVAHDTGGHRAAARQSRRVVRERMRRGRRAHAR